MSASSARAAGRRPELVADTIPLLDVAPYLAGAPGALARLGAELRWALENVGFYYLRGHGIPPSLIDATFAQAALVRRQRRAHRGSSSTRRATGCSSRGARSIPRGARQVPAGRRPRADEPGAYARMIPGRCDSRVTERRRASAVSLPTPPKSGENR